VLCINPSITYGATQRLRVLLFSGKKTLSPGDAFRTSPLPLSLHVHKLISTVLGAMSKALATLCTQPLIVAKVGLQSKPPPEREGRAFKSFSEVLRHVIQHEGVARLFKGIGPQLLKGILVQGILNMTKERCVFISPSGTVTDCRQDRNICAATAAVRAQAAHRAAGQDREQAARRASPQPRDSQVTDFVRSYSGLQMVDGSARSQASSYFIDLQTPKNRSYMTSIR
jgi:hypothetical protein